MGTHETDSLPPSLYLLSSTQPATNVMFKHHFKHVVTIFLSICLITLPYSNFELGSVQAFHVRLQVAVEDVSKHRLEDHFLGGAHLL